MKSCGAAHRQNAFDKMPSRGSECSNCMDRGAVLLLLLLRGRGGGQEGTLEGGSLRAQQPDKRRHLFEHPVRVIRSVGWILPVVVLWVAVCAVLVVIAVVHHEESAAHRLGLGALLRLLLLPSILVFCCCWLPWRWDGCSRLRQVQLLARQGRGGAGNRRVGGARRRIGGHAGEASACASVSTWIAEKLGKWPRMANGAAGTASSSENAPRLYVCAMPPYCPPTRRAPQPAPIWTEVMVALFSGCHALIGVGDPQGVDQLPLSRRAGLIGASL